MGAVVRSMLTPGRAVAFVVTLGAVYWAWGIVFQPGGTGSNVVLGLLMAIAAIYLVTVNLGTFLDDMFFAREDRAVSELLRFAAALLSEVDDSLKAEDKRKTKKLSDDVRARLDKLFATLRDLMVDIEELRKKGEEVPAALVEKFRAGADALDREATAALGAARKGSVFHQLRSLGVAFAVALALRAFVVEPFQIPSGSMIPTLLIGDHLFVARFWYGLSLPFSDEPTYLVRWSMPEPGDVVVFVAPRWVGPNAGEDWIKRVIAGPGQKVRMRDGVMYVDDEPYDLVGRGEQAQYLDHDETTQRWHMSRAKHQRERIGDREHSIYLGSPTKLTWPVVIPGTKPRFEGLDCDETACTVKDGFVFVMGDNRDNSSDGRVWGAVPADNVKGRALFIWMSVDGSQRSVDLGRFTLPRFRWDRLFNVIE